MKFLIKLVRETISARGMRVTGSELVGLVPKKVLIDAVNTFLMKQKKICWNP